MSVYAYLDKMQLLCCRCASIFKVLRDKKKANEFTTAEDEFLRRKNKLTFETMSLIQDSEKVKELESFEAYTNTLQKRAYKILEELV